jgi:hypothetical protein
VDSFQQSAGQSVGFMTALGGVAITALTLVLALDRERVDRRVFKLLPAALITATIAAFGSAALMANVSGLADSASAAAGDAAGAAPVSGGLRLYLVAQTTEHTAGALFLFILMLLPAVYDIQGATRLAQRLGFWSFIFFEASAGVGVVQSVRWHHHPATGAALAVTGVLAVLLIIVFTVRRPGEAEGFEIAPFLLSTAAVCAATIVYTLTYRERGAPGELDIWFFCLASSLPTAALIGLAMRIYREEQQEAVEELRGKSSRGYSSP